MPAPCYHTCCPLLVSQLSASHRLGIGDRSVMPHERLRERRGVTAAPAASSPRVETPKPEAVANSVLPSAVRDVSIDALDVLAARIRVHTHNIANAHTVGYKRLMLHVEEHRPEVVRTPGLEKDVTGTAAPAGLRT